MKCYNYMDILAELTEFSLQIISDIRQQLLYYRASVYQAETSEKIQLNIMTLHKLSTFLGCAEALECFADYQATLAPTQVMAMHQGNAFILRLFAYCLTQWRKLCWCL